MSEDLPLLHLRESDHLPVESLGPYRIQTLIRESEEGGVTAYRVRIEAQQKTAVSYHKIAEELYYVIAGTGVAILDGVERYLAAVDFLRLPPGTTHGFVTGEEELVMLNIHSPGSRPDRDVYFVGETPPGFGSR